jgi:hypothetical protein
MSKVYCRCERKGYLCGVEQLHRERSAEGQVLHGKFFLQSLDDTVEKLRGSCEHNVINIEKQVDTVISSAKNE